MRLIDADALKKEFPKDTDWEYPVNTNSYVCEMIDSQTTIEPERKKVIRCRDCESWEHKDGFIQGYCNILKIRPTGDWFCGFAQSKGE